MVAPKYPERTNKPIDTRDKEDVVGKKIEHTRGAKIVSGDTRITNMANKTEHICGYIRNIYIFLNLRADFHILKCFNRVTPLQKAKKTRDGRKSTMASGSFTTPVLIFSRGGLNANVPHKVPAWCNSETCKDTF